MPMKRASESDLEQVSADMLEFWSDDGGQTFPQRTDEAGRAHRGGRAGLTIASGRPCGYTRWPLPGLRRLPRREPLRPLLDAKQHPAFHQEVGQLD
jgi:hypothetical protein